jgi:hypothetical protein
MSRAQQSAGNTGSLTNWPKARIIVLPTNLALASPQVEQLPPLAAYKRFLLDAATLDLNQSARDVLPESEICAGSFFPAGLAPRLRSTLQTAGYRLTEHDLRSVDGLGLDEEVCRRSYWDTSAFLLALVRNPLGQILWESFYRFQRQLDYLAALFPEARILVLGGSNNEANALWREIGGVLLILPPTPAFSILTGA